MCIWGAASGAARRFVLVVVGVEGRSLPGLDLGQHWHFGVILDLAQTVFVNSEGTDDAYTKYSRIEASGFDAASSCFSYLDLIHTEVHVR